MEDSNSMEKIIDIKKTGTPNCTNKKCPWGKYQTYAKYCCSMACFGMIEESKEIIR